MKTFHIFFKLIIFILETRKHTKIHKLRQSLNKAEKRSFKPKASVQSKFIRQHTIINQSLPNTRQSKHRRTFESPIKRCELRIFKTQTVLFIL